MEMIEKQKTSIGDKHDIEHKSRWSQSEWVFMIVKSVNVEW